MKRRNSRLTLPPLRARKSHYLLDMVPADCSLVTVPKSDVCIAACQGNVSFGHSVYFKARAVP